MLLRLTVVVGLVVATAALSLTLAIRIAAVQTTPDIAPSVFRGNWKQIEARLRDGRPPVQEVLASGASLEQGPTVRLDLGDACEVRFTGVVSRPAPGLRAPAGVRFFIVAKPDRGPWKILEAFDLHHAEPKALRLLQRHTSDGLHFEVRAGDRTLALTGVLQQANLCPAAS